MKFYSPKRIGQRKAQYNVVFGERSNGKTTALLKQAIKNYFSTENGDYTRQQFAYIRRWDTDIKAKRMKQMFGYINSTGLVSEISNGEFDHVHFYNGVFYFAKYDGEGKSIYSPIDCLGHAFALNMMEHDKGSSYPLVTLIVFDEFIARRIYLTDEFVLLMNVISTIIRLRTNVSIWLLGNTVNKYCPYFAEFGLKNVDEMKQGTIDVYRYGDSPLKLACEYCADNSESKPNSHLFAFDNPKLNMIAGGSWELSIFPHAPMKWKPKNIQFIYFIEFNEAIYQCEIVQVGLNYFTFIHLKTTPIQNPEKDLIFSLEPSALPNRHRNVFASHGRIGRKIGEFFKNDKVFYQDNSVGNAIENYLRVCRKVVL